MRIVFAGTPEFSVPALEALVAAGHSIAAVYTQPDRPAGRGQRLAASAVKQCAGRLGLPVEQPLTLREPAVAERLAQYAAEVMVVVAYGLLLPVNVLALPARGCLNIHASLLPRWRGAAPIQRAILAGDVLTGVTIMQMDEGLDTGPMLLERTTPIGERETAASLHDRLAGLGAEAIVAALAGLQDSSLTARPQPETGITHAAKIRKEEGLIDWSKPAVQIDRQIRAFNPWPVAETRWEGRQLRIWEATPVAGSAVGGMHVPPGTVTAAAGGIQVATGEGGLQLLRLQLAGRKPVSATEFHNAHFLDRAILGGP